MELCNYTQPDQTRYYEIEAIDLVIRANLGETVVITFSHSLDRALSMHVLGMDYDVQTSDGTSAGFNKNTTTRHKIVYTWYANREGVYLFHDMGDTSSSENGTNIHGLFCAIIIEPAGAFWYRNFSFSKAFHEDDAVITVPGVESFRECVVMIQNGIRMLDSEGNLVKTIPEDEGEAIDDEDTGEKGYNYRSERFANRLKSDGRISLIFSSRIHGAPATPLFKAYTGERVIFRTMMPADKPRNVEFTVHGHQWKEQPAGPFSRVIPLQGGVSIGNTFSMELKDGASCPGDYLYRSGSVKWDIESGMWGIFRVLKQGIGCRCRNACGKVRKRICKN